MAGNEACYDIWRGWARWEQQTHRAIRQELVEMGESWGGDVTCIPNALRPGAVLYIVEVFRISALVSYTRT